MKERKKSVNWYIAATHFLTAGFAIPFLGALVIGVALDIAGVNIIGTIGDIVNLLIKTVLLFLGVIYSARYLNKTYVIENANSVINFSTIYSAVLNVIALFFFSTSENFTVNIVGSILLVVVFYFGSKKYVVANAQSPTISTSPVQK